MCGIAGILRVHPPNSDIPPPLVAIPEPWLDILDDSIKHRGPDGKGRFRDRAIRPDGSIVDVALVHRRLSILDHAGGHQPMISPRRGAGVIASTRASGFASAGAGNGRGAPWLLYESPDDPALHAWNDSFASSPRPSPMGGVGGGPSSDDLIAVVFNGCIYNHRDLRRELIAAGHTFTSDHSDTEVLVHGWREWGPKLQSRLDGMFAIATWDRARAVVHVARDQCGEKPLYWLRLDRNTIAFASVSSGLTRLDLHEGTAPAIQPEPLANWVRQGFFDRSPLPVRTVPHLSGTVFEGQLEEHGGGGLGPSLPEYPEYPYHPPDPAAFIDPLLRHAVRSRLEADVPLGCFLSAGLDSSLIAALARESIPALQTFCVRMPSAELDESEAAARVARHLGTTHHTLECKADAARDVQTLIAQLGLPFGDSSLLPTHWVSAAVARAAKVAISGDGGDEYFAGYERYRAATLLEHGSKAIALLPHAMLDERNPRALSTKVARLIRAAKVGLPQELIAIFGIDDMAMLMPHAPARYFRDPEPDAAPARSQWTALDSAHAFDIVHYLPEDLMRKVDTASMAIPLEVRAPMLEPILRHACHCLGLKQLMPRNQRKGLLKQVARKYLPADIVDRPKQGFAIPIGDWFRSDFGSLRQLLHDHLLAPEPFGPDSLGINAMISMPYVKQLLKEHDDAGTKSLWPWKGRDHSQRLYMILVLSIWAKWLAGLNQSSKR
jgi:asparagine synthase (glutamine-hydrolysing)